MNSLEKCILDALIDLKENYFVTSVKAEFETEGVCYDEVLKLKKFAQKANLGLTIKIGGCEAIRDLCDAKSLGASVIIAPMIETPYALKKFVGAIHKVFTREEIARVKFLINIETITGFNNINEILNLEEFSSIDGVVLGRGDLVGSLGLESSYVESDQILTIAKTLSNKLLEKRKDFVIGGGVSNNSLAFFKQIPYLNSFETRKIIFDSKEALNKTDISKGIIKAIEFELLWLKNKKELNGFLLSEDEKRLQILQNRQYL